MAGQFGLNPPLDTNKDVANIPIMEFQKEVLLVCVAEFYDMYLLICLCYRGFHEKGTHSYLCPQG